MAEFERELIRERVSAGMHAARKRGSRISRPRAYANADKIRSLRAQDVPWRAIAKQLGIGTGTVCEPSRMAVQHEGTHRHLHRLWAQDSTARGRLDSSSNLTSSNVSASILPTAWQGRLT
jgi:hypothetical protein